MCLKILLLSFIFAITSATDLSTIDLSAYLKDVVYLNNPPSNLSIVTNHINGVLKSLNLSDIEVNIVLNHIQDSPEFKIDSKEFENSMKYFFQTSLATNWHMKYILQEIALTANNLSVHEILYEVLWQELKKDHNKTNPFLYIELYRDVEGILQNFSSDKLNRLHHEIQTHVITKSAELLQSYFIHNSTIRWLLDELKQLNNLYEKTLPQVFENLNGIENQLLITNDLLNFDSQTQEAVYNHITYIQYLQSLNEYIPQGLYDNLEILIARTDLTNISFTQRQQYSKILPKSMGNLLAGQKICLRNTTTNFYIHECPQTYLLCTNFIANNHYPINRKKAAFEVQRIGNNQYTLRSPYWGRYFHLQNNTLKNRPTLANSSLIVSKITKNLYSHAEETAWLIRFQGDYATIQDSTRNSYVCGGDPSYWANTERYTYTRPSKDFYQKQNECLWLLEDCSDVI